MLLRLVPRGRVGLFPGFSPPLSQRASLALRGTTTMTSYSPNLKRHPQVHQYRTFRDNTKGRDNSIPEWAIPNPKWAERDPERDLPDSKWALHKSEWAVSYPEGTLPRTVKCLSVVVNPEAWEDGISGGPLDIYKKRMDPRNPRWFIGPVIRSYFQNIPTHGPEVRPDCIVILASLRFFQEVQSAHPFLFNTVNELFPRTEVGPVEDAEVLKGKLNVITAVVDKIALWHVPGRAPAATLASEGFSILCGQTEDLLPGLWDNSDFSWSTMSNETDPLFEERMWRRLPLFPAEGKNAAAKVTKPKPKPMMPYSSGPPPVIEFRVNPLRGDDRPVQVTLPLANTSYATSTAAARNQQTTPHILEVSAWARSPERQKLRPIHVEANTRTHVTIQTTSLKQPHHASNLWFQLVAITSPRKIVSGLGNILKRVEVDGESVPASKELEDIIPKLVSMRASSHRPIRWKSDSHTVKVWALIIPDEVYKKFAKSAEPSGDQQPMQLPPAFDIEGASTKDEKRLAGMSVETLQSLLIAGCDVREILSGGGGWGAKQGLLSLDPQDRRDNRRKPLTAAEGEEDEDDDMAGLERFLRTLRGEQNVGDIASPGSWVQFFVAPAALERLPWELEAHSKSRTKNKRGKPVEKLILGSADAATEEYVPEWDRQFMQTMDPQGYKYLWQDPNGVEIFRYQFGALATASESLWLDFKKPSEAVLKAWKAVETAKEAKAARAKAERMTTTVTAKATTETKTTTVTETESSGNSTASNNKSTTNDNDNFSEQEEQQDLWKDLETDTEMKITVPEFALRTNIENPLYKGDLKR